MEYAAVKAILVQIDSYCFQIKITRIFALHIYKNWSLIHLTNPKKGYPLPHKIKPTIILFGDSDHNFCYFIDLSLKKVIHNRMKETNFDTPIALKNPVQLIVISPAFENTGKIPDKYTDFGGNITPPLNIRNLPENTISLALILEDEDAGELQRDHWVVWNIPPSGVIPEGHLEGIVGMNCFNHHCYQGPGIFHRPHHYTFKVYALDTLLRMQRISGRAHIEHAMKNHIIGYGKITGTYKSVNKPAESANKKKDCLTKSSSGNYLFN